MPTSSLSLEEACEGWRRLLLPACLPSGCVLVLPCPVLTSLLEVIQFPVSLPLSSSYLGAFRVIFSSQLPLSSCPTYSEHSPYIYEPRDGDWPLFTLFYSLAALCVLRGNLSGGGPSPTSSLPSLARVAARVWPAAGAGPTVNSHALWGSRCMSPLLVFTWILGIGSSSLCSSTSQPHVATFDPNPRGSSAFSGHHEHPHLLCSHRDIYT